METPTEARPLRDDAKPTGSRPLQRQGERPRDGTEEPTQQPTRQRTHDSTRGLYHTKSTEPLRQRPRRESRHKPDARRATQAADARHAEQRPGTAHRQSGRTAPDRRRTLRQTIQANPGHSTRDTVQHEQDRPRTPAPPRDNHEPTAEARATRREPHPHAAPRRAQSA